MDNVGKEISVGNAAKIAADLTTLSLTTGMDTDAVLAVWADLHAKVSQQVIATSEALAPTAPSFVGVAPQAAQVVAPQAFNPEAALQAAFPGSAMVSAQPAVVAAPSAPPPAAIPFAGNPGGGDPQVAEAWEVFFTDAAQGNLANNWHDNRNNKRSANSPDFKHKSWKRPGDKYEVGLYIESKKNPAGLAERLAAIGIR